MKKLLFLTAILSSYVIQASSIESMAPIWLKNPRTSEVFGVLLIMALQPTHTGTGPRVTFRIEDDNADKLKKCMFRITTQEITHYEKEIDQAKARYSFPDDIQPEFEPGHNPQIRN